MRGDTHLPALRPANKLLEVLIILLAVGLLAGILAGLLGIGGGLVIVPAVTFVLLAAGHGADVAVPVAVATSLGSMLMTATSAVWFHHKRAVIDWQCVKRLAPAVAIGAVFGAALATQVPGEWLARLFAVIAAVIGLRMLLAISSHTSARSPYPRGWWGAGPLIGAISAMIGIGGGSFNVPYLARNGYSMVQSVAIASTCGWPIALAGAAVFAATPMAAGPQPALGHVWLPGLLLIGLGGMIGAPAGVALAHYLPAERLRRIFGIVLVLVAIRMAW